jgi:hypothetical protein
MELEQAQTFLAALTESDGWEVPVTFQAIDDRPERDPRLARIFHGSLRRHAAALDALNERGAGVFVTVQQTDGRGRREENIVALRACFIDCDGPRKQRLALRPSLAVRTPHGGHAYWLLEPGEDRARFRSIQQQLAAYYGSDPAVCDLPRVMRLPGTLHCKDTPAPVQLVLVQPELRYTLDALASAHPVAACATKQARVGPRARGDYHRWATGLRVSVGRRNSTAFAIAAEGFSRGLGFSEVASVVDAYCQRAGIPDEAPAVVASAHAHVRRRG